MDKLTIEEKAKAYDKVVNKLKGFMAQGVDPLITRADVQDFFPELAESESEDENIRRELIKGISKTRPNTLFLDTYITREEALAWLEKQSQVKENPISQHENKTCKENDDSLTSEDERIRKDIVFYIAANHKDDEEKARWLYWLEKQGEKEKFVKKELDCIRGYREEAIRRLQELEKQGESTDILDDAVLDSNEDGLIADTIRRKREKQGDDKAETKFKVGNWYQCTKDFFGKGVTFDKNTAYYCAKEGCLQNEYGCHIAIVKDLFDNFKLWTIQDAKDGDILSTYECGKPKIVFILKGAPKKPYVLGFHCYYNIMYPHFEFNSEKGCLAPNIEDVKPSTKEQRDLLFQKMREDGYEWDADKKELKKIEQKPAEWSEKDSLMLDSIISIVEEWESNQSEKEEEYYGESSKSDWLKSLKDRVQPQPKQEWSKEDDFMVENVRNSFGLHCGQMTDALKEQYDKFFNKVKSLRPQSHWKPSDEHYELEEFAKIVRGNLTGISKAVQKLFEAKYLQLTGNKMYGGFKD